MDPVYWEDENGLTEKIIFQTLPIFSIGSKLVEKKQRLDNVRIYRAGDALIYGDAQSVLACCFLETGEP